MPGASAGGRPRRRARRLVPLLALAAACAERAPESETTTASDSLETAGAATAPARYATYLAFAGIDGTVFFGSFVQQTGEGSLARVYDAWWADSRGWLSLLEVRDTLPVARAAWRVLPAEGMEVRVGDAREVVGLAFPAAMPGVELEAGDDVAAWTGPTGQRESIALAGLEAEGRSVGGLLYFRRAARALRFPASSDDSRGFLLADSAGNALLVEAGGDDVAVAHTWLHGSADTWDDVLLTPEPATGEGAIAAWRFMIPSAGLSGTIRAVETPSARPTPVFRVECDLQADGEPFRFAGLAIPLTLP